MRAGTQRSSQPAPDDSDDRKKAEDKPRESADQQRESADRQVDFKLGRARKRESGRKQRWNGRHRDQGQPEADRAGGERHHHAFDREQLDQPPVAGSQAHAQREFRRALRRTDEHQVGDVGAGEQQQTRHGSKNHPEDSTYRPDSLVEQREHRGAPAWRQVGCSLLDEPRHHAAHVGARGFERQTSFHSRHGDETAAAGRCRRIDYERRVQLPHASRGKREARRHHADDLARTTVDVYRLADDVARAAVVLLPESVRENDDAWRPDALVLRADRPSQQRTDPQCVEEAGGHGQSVHLVRRSKARHVHRHLHHGADAFQRLGALTPSDVVVGARHVALVALGRALPHHHQPVGLREWQRVQQHGLRHRERGDCRRDAECERGERNKGERAIAGQGPRREPDVL